MAKMQFDYGRLEGLTLSLQEMAELPQETIKKILIAGSEVVVEEQKRMIKKLGIYDTGELQQSIEPVFRKTKDKDRWSLAMIVYPYGDRREYTSKFRYKYGYKTKNRGARWYKTGGKRKITTNNDIGFIHEFGAPRRHIEPKQWMRLANINAEEDMVKAEAREYDRYLEEKEL